MAGYFVAWAQYIAAPELEDHLRKRPSARVVNLVFLSIPLIFGAILIPLTVIANQHSNAAFDDWLLLDGLLATAAENAAAGKSVDIFSIEAVKLALERESTLAVMYWRQFWSWSTSSLVVSMAVRPTASTSRARTLVLMNRQIFAFAWKSYAHSLSHSMTVLQLQRAAGSTFLSHFRPSKSSTALCSPLRSRSPSCMSSTSPMVCGSRSRRTTSRPACAGSGSTRFSSLCTSLSASYSADCFTATSTPSWASWRTSYVVAFGVAIRSDFSAGHPRPLDRLELRQRLQKFRFSSLDGQSASR